MSDKIPEALKILVVEDQEINRLGLCVMLSKIDGVTVVGEAADGREAVTKCLTLKPDIVLMDLAMPVMNGIDATQAIKKAQPEVRVIVLTTHDSDEDVFAALGAGANGYCLKTIHKAELADVLRTVATGAAWLDPAIADRVLRALAGGQHSTVPSTKTGTEGLVEPLSPRELEVLQLLVEGLSNQKMAERLFVTTDTIKSHMRHIMEKLAVSDRTQAAVKAMKTGLISPS